MASPLDTFRQSVDSSLAAERQATDDLLAQKDMQIQQLQNNNAALVIRNTALVSGVETTVTGLQAAIDSLPALRAQLQDLIDALNALPLT